MEFAIEPAWQRQEALVEWKSEWTSALSSLGYAVSKVTRLSHGLGASNICLHLADGRLVRVRRVSLDGEPFWGEDIGRRFLPDTPWVLSRLEFLPEQKLAVYPWYEGKTLQELGMQENAPALLQCFESCGRVLGQMSSVSLAEAGEFDAVGAINKPWPSVWPGYWGFWEATLHSPYLEGRIEKSILRELDEGLARSAELMQSAMTIPVLTHGDFKPSNLVLNQDRVRIVLDWDFVHAGSWLMSAGQLLRFTGELRPQVEKAIALGLSERLTLPAGWEKLARWVDVLSLVNLLSRPLSSARQIADIDSLLRETLTSGSLA